MVGYPGPDPPLVLAVSWCSFPSLLFNHPLLSLCCFFRRDPVLCESPCIPPLVFLFLNFCKCFASFPSPRDRKAVICLQPSTMRDDSPLSFPFFSPKSPSSQALELFFLPMFSPIALSFPSHLPLSSIFLRRATFVLHHLIHRPLVFQMD